MCLTMKIKQPKLNRLGQIETIAIRRRLIDDDTVIGKTWIFTNMYRY